MRGSNEMVIIGVDTGGTFTDFVFKDGKRWGVFKLLSTPSNPADAVLKGLEHVAGDEKKRIIHGSTVATNAILERKGEMTALITNKGFEDIIEIGRQNRTRLYDLYYRKEPQLVPTELRFGVRGRIISSGEELEPLDMDDAKKIVDRIRSLGVRSVAICLLFSYLNSSHEKMLGELFSDDEISVSLSHEILSEFREFERASTTVLNAYVCPKMKRYIDTLIENLNHDDTLSIMQSNGGSISADTAMRESVRTILSGPAGGVVGAHRIAEMMGYTKLITFDMGGTSTDVSLVDRNPTLTVESSISGYPIKVPMIDIHTVGAGGGSIARIDSGGSLRVGPESAGADPGPICYGKGTEITVTDANLFLGRLIPERFLGGHMKIYPERLKGYFLSLSKEAGLDTLELAEGILSVVNATMEKAIRVISVERGYDPREFALFSFGGAGAMHAPFLAKLLNIPKVIVPKNPGILSAIGMIMADVIKDYSLTIMRNQSNIGRQELVELFKELETRAIEDMKMEGISGKDLFLERYLDMRYEGQSYEIIVPFEEDYIDLFHSMHEKKYGYRNPERIVEVVNLRLRARGLPEKPSLKRSELRSSRIPNDAIIDQRDIIFDQKSLTSLVIERDRLRPGNRIPGPAVVVEYSSTVVIPPFAEAEIDEYENIILEVSS